MTGKIVVISTCGTEEEAARIAERLVTEKVAACVSVIPRLRSFYRWEGKLENTDEVLLLIKSSREHFDKLCHTLESCHSYQIPEILALPVIDGSPSYLGWLDRELAGE